MVRAGSVILEAHILWNDNAQERKAPSWSWENENALLGIIRLEEEEEEKEVV